MGWERKVLLHPNGHDGHAEYPEQSAEGSRVMKGSNDGS